MDKNRVEISLEGVRELLSHLQNEVVTLEAQHDQVLALLRKLEETADVDELTGLMRRKSFFQKWRAVLEDCERKVDECAVLMVDVDHFKQLNDDFGHAVGDEVLARVGRLLKQFESDHCWVGRYGGEEFCIAVRGSQEEALEMAERIREVMTHLHEEGATLVPRECTVSIGVAPSNTQDFNETSLMERADQALYQAKRTGRNRVVLAA